MASKKVEAALLKQKEAKQKKVLFVLVPIFLGLAVWQGPKTFKAVTGGNAPPPPPAAAVTTTAPTPGSAPSTPGAGAVVVPPSQLVDTDAPPSLMDGQMSNLGVFPGRDPFSGGAITPGLGDVSTGGAGTGTGTTSTTTRTSARVEVNGGAEDVSIGDTFPGSDPAFKLVSVTASSAMISLASGGTFTNGDQSEQIKVGETLTVVGDDGSTFSIKLVSTS